MIHAEKFVRSERDRAPAGEPAALGTFVDQLEILCGGGEKVATLLELEVPEVTAAQVEARAKELPQERLAVLKQAHAIA